MDSHYMRYEKRLYTLAISVLPVGLNSQAQILRSKDQRYLLMFSLMDEKIKNELAQLYEKVKGEFKKRGFAELPESCEEHFRRFCIGRASPMKDSAEIWKTVALRIDFSKDNVPAIGQKVKTWRKMSKGPLVTVSEVNGNNKWGTKAKSKPSLHKYATNEASTFFSDLSEEEKEKKEKPKISTKKIK